MTKHQTYPDSKHGNYVLDETIAQTPIAKNMIPLGDFITSLHAGKEGEEDYIGEHIFGRGMEFLTPKETYNPHGKQTTEKC